MTSRQPPGVGHTVIGIDFGTSNTLCCHIDLSSEAARKPTPFAFDHDGRASFPTALLYHEAAPGQWRLLSFGRAAEEEWSLIAPGEYARYRYVANFKPDLATSPEARAHAVAFLTEVARHLFDSEKLHGIRLNRGQQTVIGVPATPLAGHESQTSAIAQEAGFENVQTVAEPLCAFAFHLYMHDVALSRVNAGVLVVDFGGGTCDFAFVSRGECQHAWGNPLYGGRLFDDLFFEWLSETNPGVTDRLERDGCEAFVHWNLCRKAKEVFSRRMAKDRTGTVTLADFGGYGSLRDITWQQFLDRSAAYVPSPRFQEMLTGSGLPFQQQFGTGPVNLIDHFRASLLSGLATHGIRESQIEFVILAGGSSLWPFVTDCLVEALHLPSVKIKQSANPQETVGMGAALLPKLSDTITRIKRQLSSEAPEQSRKLTQGIIEASRKVSRDVAEELSGAFVSNHVVPLFSAMKEAEGSWSIAQLKKRIDGEVEAFRPDAEARARRHLDDFAACIKLEITQGIQAWLMGYDLGWECPPVDKVVDLSRTPSLQVGVADPLLFAIAASVTAVMAKISAAVCGGAGWALVMHGPLGLLIGGVVGLAAGALATMYGWDKAKEIVESCPIPSAARRLILTDKLLSQLRLNIRDEIQKRLDGEFTAHLSEVKQQLDTSVRYLVDDLGWVNTVVGQR